MTTSIKLSIVVLLLSYFHQSADATDIETVADTAVILTDNDDSGGDEGLIIKGGNASQYTIAQFTSSVTDIDSTNVNINGYTTTDGLSNVGSFSQDGTTNINTTSTYATTIGNTDVSSMTNIYGGDSRLSITDGEASLSSGSTSGFSAYSTSQVVGTDYTLVNGNVDTKAIINGASVNNIIKGNTLIDGNMYINGSLTYSSNTAATTTVTSGTSQLQGATTTTTGEMNIANSGGASVDANGKLSTTGATGTTASLTLTNGLGNTHGLVVTESQTTISGGTQSTSMTLNDNGATFSNAQNGNPVQVHGVADGTDDFDAANIRQLKKAYSGIAGVAAMSQLPDPVAGYDFSFGIGAGYYENESALAMGFKAQVCNTTVSVAGSYNAQDTHTVAAGVGWSW